ncbi:unnamed protein product [Echinostoma caproni]|uniref:Ras-associating domain-containing protein n=1 Tax=Echinostoma caproni TaxID=27848 RepID=A0A183A9C0_9TREM|nr:unnamed protein product [Echinostoma caproni]
MSRVHEHNKSGRKTKVKMGKDKIFGSSTSLNSSKRKSDIVIPEELSLEEVKTNDGISVTYLRIYCEKIRPGDHFKTLKVYGTTTAEQCVKELTEMYSTRIASPDEVALYEVIGRIEPVSSAVLTQDSLLGFSEVRCRLIEPQETVKSIFSGSRAGVGLSRRIEIRRLDYPHTSFPAAAGTRVPTPTPSPRPRSANKDLPPSDRRRSSTESNTSISGMPMIRRSMTPAGSSFTLRDSRRKSKYRIPHGPHLTLIRGLQPKCDRPLWDLTPIIQKNRTRSEMTIGTREDASIRTYDSPDENLCKQSVPIIFAKLVAYDYPLTNDGSLEHTGAIFIEPYINERINGHMAEFPQVPPIYINEDLINPGPNLSFDKRLLHPGDFIYFGPKQQGYVFLFKDPRWIPDHRLEINTPLTGSNMGSTMTLGRMNSITMRNGNGTGNGRNAIQSDRSSDTDSSFSRPRTTGNGMFPTDRLPRLANLRQTLAPLFPQLHASRSHQYAPMDPLESPRWSRTEPWRSAGFFAHLVRTAAGYIIQNNPQIPNRDVEERDPKLIQDYAINYVKDMRSLMIEFCQTLRAKNPDLVVPELWFSLFCYNVAIYLSPGWLTNSTGGLSRRTSRNDRFRSQPWDGSESATSSPNSNSDIHGNVESLQVVSDLRDSAYQIATESINSVVRTAFEELPPYLKSFLNGPNSSPISANTFFPNNIVNFPELRHRLGKLANCFQVAFYPTGMGEVDVAASTASSPFHTGSMDSSNMMLDNLPEQRTWRANGTRGRQQRGFNPMDQSDHSLSPGSESDHGDQGTLYDASQLRQSNQSSVWNSASERGSIDTASRIEAVVWRHILAGVSHHLLYTLVSNDSIPIDWETGDKLLRGINWLYDWLRSQHLEAHRRPLNMVADFANLLATPREQLFKMSWSGMRSIYPQIPPTLLKFLLDEYEADGDIKDMPNWRVDQRDANEADEDALEVLDRVMNTWRSKESLLYSKTHYQTAPIYRPRDLWDLFNLSTTVEVARRWDIQLESQRIEFRWLALMQYSPGARAIPLMPEADQDTLSRPQSRQRQATGRRSRAANGQQQPLRASGPSPFPRRDLTKSNPNLYYHSDDYPTNNMQIDCRRKEHEIVVPGVGGRDGLSDRLKPAPSKGEPVRIIRTYNNDQQPERTVIVPKETPKDPRDAALYHLEGLAASLPHVDFSEILARYQRQASTPGGPKSSFPNREPMAPREPSVFESQPNFNFSRPNQPEVNGYYGNYPKNSPAATEYSHMTPLNKTLQPTNRLAQSLWHLPSEEPPTATREITKAQNTYGHQVLAASQNWEDFRMNTLRRGMDRIRGPNTGSSMLIPRHPMHSMVSASLGNLHAVLNQPQTPNIIVEEPTGGSSGSLADSFLDRESNAMSRMDDLGDVLARSTQGAMISNVTLVRSPTSGFGLTLVDGERTLLDQPGVFVKGVNPNSPASENGELDLGDRILAINGIDLTGLTYKESLAMLKNCGSQATFTVRHSDVSNPNLLLERKKS